MSDNKALPSRKAAERTCSKPGCSEQALYTMAFDYRRAEVWLCDLWAESGPGSYDLCKVHAERLCAPSGWSYVDKRSAPPLPSPSVTVRVDRLFEDSLQPVST
jgi:hypothetical protein